MTMYFLRSRFLMQCYKLILPDHLQYKLVYWDCKNLHIAYRKVDVS
jgi:hypothetical protein